jgi:hypothetical protein
MLTPQTVFARQVGRIAFGVVAIAGAVVLIGRALDVMSGGGIWSGRSDAIDAAIIIAITWPSALIAAVVARRLARSSHGSRRPDRLLAASLAIPGVGIALLAPISCHLVFFVRNTSGFDDWVVLTVVVAGVAHVVFAALTAMRGVQLARGASRLTPNVIYGLVVLAACIPYGMYVVPPILVAFTGIPFWAMLDHMQRLAEREREVIPELPIAVALPHA